MKYAGFWVRVSASFIDFIIIAPIILLVFMSAGTSNILAILIPVPVTFFYSFYFVYFNKRYGATIGKKLMKIKIVKLDGKKIGWKEAILRNSVEIILDIIATVGIIIGLSNFNSQEFYSLGYFDRLYSLIELPPNWEQSINRFNDVWVISEFATLLTNPKRRALHDFLAGTIVIHVNK